jgi:excisionase family DNA binding protein
MLCVSEGLINKLVGERGMPHIKLGRTIRFSVSEVKNWMMQKGIKQ